MTFFSTTLAAVAASFALAAPVAPVTPAPTVDLSRPAQLARGDDLRLPHQVGTAIVDGDVRVELGTERFLLLGPSGDDYVVHRWTQRFGRDTVVRVTPSGEQTVLLRGRDAWGASLSDDGAHVVTSDSERRTALTAYDASDGTELASTTVRGYAEVLDVDGGVVLASSWERARTLTWDLTTGAHDGVTPYAGYVGDLSSDRLALLTDDPYSGGCSLVTTVSGAAETLWESCRQKVTTFSVDGERLASVHILTEGVGPGEVQLRETDGTRLARYRANWFGALGWEDADTLLLDANGARRGAVVRCDLDVCERAGGLHPSAP